MAPAEVNPPDRAAGRAGAIVAVWAFAIGALALNRHLVGVFYDDGLYAGLATALADGQGFVHPHLPGDPPPAAIHYPPLYPVVLAPLFGMLSVDLAGFAGKLLNLFLASAAAGIIAAHVTQKQLLGERAPAWLPGAVVAAAAVAVPVLTTQSVLFAEPLFAVLLAVTVMCADAVGPGGSRRLPLLAGFGAALTLLTRTIGVAAGAGVCVFLFRKGDRRAAIMAAVPVAVAAVAWLAWTTTHRQGIDPALAINYGSYGEVLRQAGFGALGTSALDLPRPLVAISLGWLGALAPPLAFVALAIGLYGLWLVSGRSSAGFTLAAYVAILAIWPFPPDRFLWAVLPWLAIVWVAGAVALLSHRWLRIPTAVVAVAALVGFGIYQVRGMTRRAWASQSAAISQNFNELLPALRELPPAAVLAIDDEALVWLYARRRAVPLLLYGYDGAKETSPTPAEHRAYLERQGVTHVVLASASAPSAAELRALIATYPGWLQPVHGWPGGRWIFAVGR